MVTGSAELTVIRLRYILPRLMVGVVSTGNFQLYILLRIYTRNITRFLLLFDFRLVINVCIFFGYKLDRSIPFCSQRIGSNGEYSYTGCQIGSCIRYFFLGNPVFGFLRNNYFIVCIGKQVDFQMIVSCSRHLNDTALFSHFNDQVTACLHNSEFSSQRIIGDSNISFSDSFFGTGCCRNRQFCIRCFPCRQPFFSLSYRCIPLPVRFDRYGYFPTLFLESNGFLNLQHRLSLQLLIITLASIESSDSHQQNKRDT